MFLLRRACRLVTGPDQRLLSASPEWYKTDFPLAFFSPLSKSSLFTFAKKTLGGTKGHKTFCAHLSSGPDDAPKWLGSAWSATDGGQVCRCRASSSKDTQKIAFFSVAGRLRGEHLSDPADHNPAISNNLQSQVERPAEVPRGVQIIFFFFSWTLSGEDGANSTAYVVYANEYLRVIHAHLRVPDTGLNSDNRFRCSAQEAQGPIPCRLSYTHVTFWRI